MKVSILLAILFCGSSAAAQSISITRLRVSETDSLLIVEGRLGSTAGTLSVNGIQLPVSLWSDSEVIATIPETGIASAGEVRIANDHSFDVGNLARLDADESIGNGFEDTGIRKESRNTLHSVIRFDARILIDTIPSTPASLNSATSISIRYAENNLHPFPGVLGQLQFDETSSRPLNSGRAQNFGCSWQYDPRYGTFEFDITRAPTFVGHATLTSEATGHDTIIPINYGGNPFSTFVGIDSATNVVEFSHQYGHLPGGGYSADTSVSGKLSFVPSSIVALGQAPTLVYPLNGGAGDRLEWQTLPTISWYEVEVSEESSFMNPFDSIIQGTSLQLPTSRLGKTEYWRVRGVNTIGKTKWSPVWSIQPAKRIEAMTTSTDFLRSTGSSLVYLLSPQVSVRIEYLDPLGRSVGSFAAIADGAVHSVLYPKVPGARFAVVTGSNRPLFVVL